MKTDLTKIPGVGPNMEKHLVSLGYSSLDSLKGADPEKLYEQDRKNHSGTLDRCVLYVYRLAVYYAENEIRDPEKLNWWWWKDRK